MLLRKFWHNERAGIVVISLKLLAQSIRSHLTMPALFSGDSSGDFPRHHQPLIFARASAMLRISSRTSKTTPAEYSGQTSGGAIHPVFTAHHRPVYWPGYSPHTHLQALIES